MHRSSHSENLSRPSTPASWRPSARLVLIALGLGAGVWGSRSVLQRMRSVKTPAGLPVVHGFDIHRYMGHWYEVARIEQPFERGMVYTTASYTLRSDGTIKVFNRGYQPQSARWKEAVGTARFQQAHDCAAMKVSFMGPFYSGYHVVSIDPEYRWAMVIGSSMEDFWILSRTPLLPDHLREALLEHANALGVDLCKVLWIPQGSADHPEPESPELLEPQPAVRCD